MTRANQKPLLHIARTNHLAGFDIANKLYTLDAILQYKQFVSDIQSTCLGMHHRCSIGKFRHLGLARSTNIIMCCSSLDFLCILEERLKILLCRVWDG